MLVLSRQGIKEGMTLIFYAMMLLSALLIGFGPQGEKAPAWYRAIVVIIFFIGGIGFIITDIK